MPSTCRRQARRRKRLFEEHPFCYWCGTELIEMPHDENGKQKLPVPDNAATLDHLRSAWNPKAPAETVLACHKCNHTRGREEEKSAGIDVLRERSQRHPKRV